MGIRIGAGAVVAAAAVGAWAHGIGTPPDVKYCRDNAGQFTSYQACVDWYRDAAESAGPSWR